jgi:CDGSH-type Zn-finger protein
LNNNNKIKTVNPATEEVIEEYEIMTKEQINDRVIKAKKAFQDWKKDASKRTDLLHDYAKGASKEHYTLCRCGASSNKPLCDGMHRTVNFKDDKNC